MTALTAYRPFSFNDYASKQLRSLANRLDGINIAPPSLEDVRREQLREASIALLTAESEAERYTHTVAMLRKRVARLQG